MTLTQKIFPLVFILLAFTGCKIASILRAPVTEIGTYKVTILYPNGEGKTFDMDYYEKKHMPMVAGFLGKNLRFYEIDKGISGRTATEQIPFLAIGYFYVKDVAAYNKAIAQNRDTVVNDFKNYTNIQPVVQISEIKYLGDVK